MVTSKNKRSASTRSLLVRLVVVGLLSLFAGACGTAKVIRPVVVEPTRPSIVLDTISIRGRVAVTIDHPDWETNTWQYRTPEYLIIKGKTSEILLPEALKDTMDGSITLFGRKAAPDSGSYSIVFRPSSDHVDVKATVTNISNRPWGGVTFGLACLTFSAAPEFFDSTMTRTFAHFDSVFMPLNLTPERAGITFRSPRFYQHSAHVLREEHVGWRGGHDRKDVVDCSLIVRSSEDSLYHVAQAWQDAFNVSYNFYDVELNCIHSNPRFNGLGPGETRSVRGRIYFFAGTIDELYARFLEDFPSRGYGTPPE